MTNIIPRMVRNGLLESWLEGIAALLETDRKVHWLRYSKLMGNPVPDRVIVRANTLEDWRLAGSERSNPKCAAERPATQSSVVLVMRRLMRET